MVVDYRLLNRKVVFDAFPMPNVENAFANFAKATIFFCFGPELSLLPDRPVGEEPEGYGLLYPLWALRVHEFAHGD
jgi:hypothetical protein